MKTKVFFLAIGVLGTGRIALADANTYGTRGSVLVPDPDGGTPTYTPQTSEDNQPKLTNAEARQAALGNYPYAISTYTGTSGAPPNELPNPQGGVPLPTGSGGSMGAGTGTTSTGGTGPGSAGGAAGSGAH